MWQLDVRGSAECECQALGGGYSINNAGLQEFAALMPLNIQALVCKAQETTS